MSITLIIILSVVFNAVLAGIIHYTIFSKDKVVLMGEPGRGESRYVENPVLVERTIRTRGKKTYTARLKRGRSGNSYHDFDFFDELENFIYDIYLMQALFDFIEGVDYEDGYFEFGDDLTEEFVAEEEPAKEFIAPEAVIEEEPAKEFIAPEAVIEEEPAQESIVEETVIEEEPAPEAPVYSEPEPEYVPEERNSYSSESSYSSSSSSDYGSSDSGGSDD